MSTLLNAMAMLQSVFDKYAGQAKTLSRNELSKLLQTELNIQQKDNEEVTKFMTMLDENGDGRVDFKEYVVFVVSLAMIM